MFGLLGKKQGMTQVFGKEGEFVPVTVVHIGPCVVTQKKTKQDHGYDAVQIGFEERKEEKLSKPLRGFFKKQGVKGYRYVREFRVPGDVDIALGYQLKAELFQVGDMVNVSGVTKGHGFQGVIKRHGKQGGPASHGSDFHRRTGSIGMRTWPARVFKNTRLPGHMGVDRVTVRNLEVVGVLPEEQALLIRGAVPGFSGGVVEVVSQDEGFLKRGVGAAEVKA